jgi:hypothetical protein
VPGCRHAGRLRGKAAGWHMQMTRVVLVSGGERLLGQRAVWQVHRTLIGVQRNSGQAPAVTTGCCQYLCPTRAFRLRDQLT